MELGTLLQQVLGPLMNLTGRQGIWPAKAEDNIVPPYAVYHYWGPSDYYLNGQKVAQQNKQVQIDVWAKTVTEACSLADAIETAMDAEKIWYSPTTFTSMQTGRQLPPPDPDSRLNRVILEFSVTYRP